MLKTRNRLVTAAFTLSIACLLPTQAYPSNTAGAGTPAADQGVDKNVAAMEGRFFSHQYASDPIEKRIERLELLVFGSMQSGDVPERYARLKKAIADRANLHVAGTKTGESSKSGSGQDKAASSSAQYPAINNLERRILKQTYPHQSLDARLSRLEKKVFGADSPAMAYADRVDRLKRTLEGAIAAQQPTSAVRVGPAPKARPRGQANPDFFTYGTPPLGGSDDGFFSDDGMGAMPGFGMGMPGGLGGMMRQMERQMRQMEVNVPPGVWTMDPKTGTWVERNTGRHFKPNAPDGSAAPLQTQPSLPKSVPFHLPHNDSELPPYSDPNSI